MDSKVRKLNKLLKLKSKLSKLEDELKAEIRAAYLDGTLLPTSKKGKSEFVKVDGLAEQLRITTTSPEPTVDFEKLRTLIDDDEVYFSLVTVKTASLNLEKWEEAVSLELVRDAYLLDSVVEKEGSLVLGFGKGVNENSK